MKKVAYVGITLRREMHPVPCSLVVPCLVFFRWFNDGGAHILNKGRGEVVGPALMVVFHLVLKCRLVGGWMEPWWWYEQNVERAVKCGNVPNVEQAETVHLGKGAKRGFVFCSR